METEPKYKIKNLHRKIKTSIFNRCKNELDKKKIQEANLLALHYLWLYPNDLIGRSKIKEMFYSSAVSLIKKREYEDALWLIKIILSDDLKEPNALYLLGYLYLVSSNSKEDLNTINEINIFYTIIEDTLIITITYYNKINNKYKVVISQVIGSGKLSGHSTKLKDIKKYIRNREPIDAEFVILKQGNNEYLLYVYPINKFNILTIKKEREMDIAVINYQGKQMKRRKKKGIEDLFDLDFKLVEVA